MKSSKSGNRYEVAVFASLAVLVVMAMGALLNAAFNVQIIL